LQPNYYITIFFYRSGAVSTLYCLHYLGATPNEIVRLTRSMYTGNRAYKRKCRVYNY